MIGPCSRELSGIELSGIELGAVEEAQVAAPDVTFAYRALSGPRQACVNRTIVYFKIYVNLD